MIALSVAAALAIFVVYTALAGNGVAHLTPSTVAGHTGDVSLVGKVVGRPQGNAYQGGLRFRLEGHRPRDGRRASPSCTAAAVPDLFKTGARHRRRGKAAERRLRREAGLDDHEVPGSLRAGEVLQDLADGPARARRAPPRLRPRRVRAGRGLVRRVEAAPPARAVGAERAHRRVPGDARRGRSSCSSHSRRHDFTFVYVWQHTSHKLPLGYALSAFWGGQEGSLLLWLLVLTGYAALAVWLNRRSRELVAWTVPVFGLVAVFFAFMLCFVSSPFSLQPTPADGNGMVPSLQNPYMLAHPPLLYLGYVGLTVPFAFAMGALLSGRTDERWIVATRRWTLAAWTFLGVGQLIGAHWAYVEIGWGGYYAWDPVENAALMPWLAATAFLHSVMIQEKRGMLKVWNMVLVALAFNLSLFGTFLTRSGVINSIHSFSKSSIGGWFLGFLGLMIFLSIALIRWRLPLLRTKTKLESLVSREATFLYNNLLLVALA